jgi:hypothetical protein
VSPLYTGIQAVSGFPAFEGLLTGAADSTATHILLFALSLSLVVTVLALPLAGVPVHAGVLLLLASLLFLVPLLLQSSLLLLCLLASILLHPSLLWQALLLLVLHSSLLLQAILLLHSCLLL